MSPRAVTPTKATSGAVGFDLYSAEIGSIDILPGSRVAIVTGLKLEIPPGYEGQIRSRSGLATGHGVIVLNSPGTIDSDFRGELCVTLHNTCSEFYTVRYGDRIAQLIIAKVEDPVFVEVVELSSTERGDNGHGSTGR